MLTFRDDRIKLLSIMFCLIFIGLLFTYSAGSLQAVRLRRIPGFFLYKQLISLTVGMLVLYVATKIPLNFYRKYIIFIYFVTFSLLLFVYTQRPINGAYRWLNIPYFSFQPSEVAKFTIVLYLAHYFDKKSGKLSNFSQGFLPATIMVGFLATLILMEPDFGTTFLITLVVLTLFILGGMRYLHIFGVLTFFTPIFLSALLVGYRKGRILAFLNPWQDRYRGGYQLIQSYAAVGNGGIFGKGIGNSSQKLFFLPEAHTDFIYAIIAEETGLIGSVFIILLILSFFFLCLKASLRHNDVYKRLLMIGLTCLIFYQSVINIFVVLGLLPTKGITLPFISYGGSALVVSMFFVGVLLRGMEEAN